MTVTDFKLSADPQFIDKVRDIVGLAPLPFRRWREVEVHLVDLGIGLTPADWPQELVDRVFRGWLQVSPVVRIRAR